MQKMTLKFRSVGQLWEFKQTIKAHEVEVNLHKCTLRCNCSEAEVALAVEKFGAVLITENAEE